MRRDQTQEKGGARRKERGRSGCRGSALGPAVAERGSSEEEEKGAAPSAQSASRKGPARLRDFAA